MKKIKIASLSPQPLLLIMATFTLIAVPLRMFQLTNCIDATTGFWVVKDVTMWILYILCAVFVVIAFFISFLSGIMKMPELDDKRDIPLAIFASLLSIALIVDAVRKVPLLITLIEKIDGPFGIETVIYIISSGTLPLALQVLSVFFATIYIMFVAVSFIKGNGAYKKRRLLALWPTLWAMFRLIYHFIDPINYKNVSQLFFQMILLSFMMIFYLSFARLASQVNADNSMSTLWFSGISAAFMGFVSSLSPILLMIFGKADLLPAHYPVYFSDLAFALFVTAFLFTVVPRTIKKKIES
ncbi:MAG: hypothetical protein GX241_03015 [Ruminococcaceae bacterium]|nr:hypothetical protein [Oscillospiraceae bacterium]